MSPTISNSVSLYAEAPFRLIRLCHYISAILIVCLVQGHALGQATPISTVDTSLVGSQKYVLRVGGKPFFPIGIQARFDKLRYYGTYLFTMAQCNALAAQAAADGFNYIIVPITWNEVEPVKDNFDWTVLDQYLAIANANNIKMELLWEGVNDDGATGTQGTTDNTAGAHLRTPDYVLYAPSPGSTATTSSYTIVSGSPYTLDLSNTSLQARETYVLNQVANHVATWDVANGGLHPVIGFQIENEPQKFSDAITIGYISAVGMGVKNSNYSVWTRSNTIDTAATVSSRAAVNQTLRAGAGTGLDFVGIDNYSNTTTVIEAAQPIVPNNYPEIMENGGTNSSTVRLAALAGDTSLATYDLCGPDGHGLYALSSPGVCTPSGSNITLFRLMNHMLASDTFDLALNSQAAGGLFVHNWAANATTPTSGGFLNITYTPTSNSDQGISIHRSDTEIVLMSTGGGTFTYPAALQVSSASQGYFDTNNVWVSQSNYAFTSTSVTMTAGATVRLTYTLPPPSAPTGLAVVAVGNGQVQLKWNTASYATTYNVKRSLVSGGPYTTVSSSPTSPSYSDSGLVNGTTYYYVVSSVDSSGESANSNEVKATPNVSTVQVEYAATTLVFPGSTKVTACVPATNNVTPTGSVKVYDGTTVLTTLTLQNAGCASWYINPGLAVGTHQLSVTYGGDGVYPAELSAATTITVTAAPRVVSFTPQNFDYGTVKVGTPTTEVFTFINSDSGSHTISAIKLTAESTNSYSMSTNCPGAINAHASCTVTVTFTPTTVGPISTTLTQTGGGGTATASITGTGVLGTNVAVAHSDQTLFVYPANFSMSPTSSPGGGVGLAVDASGSIFSIDTGGSSVSKFSDAGTILGSLSDAGLSGATALTVDGLSNVWVTNGDGTVSAFDSTGTVIGTGAIGAAGNLSQPSSVNVDAAGSLWIANSGNNTVTEIIGVAAPAAPLVQQVVHATPGARP